MRGGDGADVLQISVRACMAPSEGGVETTEGSMCGGDVADTVQTAVVGCIAPSGGGV